MRLIPGCTEGLGGLRRCWAFSPGMGRDHGCQEPVQPRGAGWVLFPILWVLGLPPDLTETPTQRRQLGNRTSHPGAGVTRGQEEKGPRWCAGAPQNPCKPAPSPGPLGANPRQLRKVMGPASGAGDAGTHPAPWEEQMWGFLLINLFFFLCWLLARAFWERCAWRRQHG